MGRWGREGDAEYVVGCAVGGYRGGPEFELAGANREIWLEGVEGWVGFDRREVRGGSFGLCFCG